MAEAPLPEEGAENVGATGDVESIDESVSESEEVPTVGKEVMLLLPLIEEDEVTVVDVSWLGAVEVDETVVVVPAPEVG